jgi:competence protein ComEA
MLVLNASERRGALVVVLLLAIGAGHDLWRARRPRAGTPPPPAPAAPDPRPAADSGAVAGAARAGGPSALDLNRAGAAELDALPGIGPVLARRIVEHRIRHGPFRRVEELRAVRGVGPLLLDRLRERVRVEPPASPEP